MIAVDTSVVIAGLLLDHEQHHRAQPVLASRPAIPAHAALESYSVLTRLPAPGRVSPADAAQMLVRAFAGRYVALSVEEHEALVSELSRRGIMGGAVYDALIAATAVRHGLTLRTLDERATATYDAIGVNFELI